jgi:hypothetical protein
VGVEFLTAEGGILFLKDPQGSVQAFHYGAAGAGLAFGLKLPKIGKLNLPKIKGKEVGAVMAPNAFPNGGRIYVLDNFRGSELRRSDITGVCMFLEVGLGLGGGGSASAMIFGMNPALIGVIAETMVLPPLMVLAETALLASATGILIFGGYNVGLQAGGGGAVYIGGLG